jgi:hypothetical protein
VLSGLLRICSLNSALECQSDILVFPIRYMELQTVYLLAVCYS